MQQAVEAGLAELGKIDIVCANAGIGTWAVVWEMTEQQWSEMIDINLTGVFNTVRAALPSMVQRGEGGSLVLTSSTAGLRAYPNTAHYTAAKHGVIGLMKVLAQECGPHMHPGQRRVPDDRADAAGHQRRDLRAVRP